MHSIARGTTDENRQARRVRGCVGRFPHPRLPRHAMAGRAA